MTLAARRTRLATLAALLGLAACAATPAPDGLPINAVQVIGTHNSYHAGIAPHEAMLWRRQAPKLFAMLDYRHPSLTAQLDSGVRQIELDVYADPQGGRYARPAGPRQVAAAGLPLDPPFDPAGLMNRPGFKVMHVIDVDYRSVCQPFLACLREVRAWSAAHPAHVPIYILVETKQKPEHLPFPSPQPLPFTPAMFDRLDAEIRVIFPQRAMLTPDDLRGDSATLPDAIRRHGWPRLGAMRGHVVFLMDQHAQTPQYVAGHVALRGRVMFTNATPGDPDAAFVEANVPSHDIDGLVRAGYLVRTRSDDGLVEAREDDTRRRDAALASGAQIVSTDFPAHEPAATGYAVALPHDAPARCDRVVAARCPGAPLDPYPATP